MTKQYQSESIIELAAALAKAQGDFTHATKDVKNEFFKSRYADLPAVMDAARPHLAKNGLSVIQITEMDDQSQISLITQLTHSSGQFIRSWYPVRPVKSDPQAMGSALTYARRYAYSSLVGVAAADEDDDGNAASGHRPNTANVEPQRKSASFDEIKTAIEKSTDPAATWHQYLPEMNDLMKKDKARYDELVKAGAARRTELMAKEQVA